MLQDLGALGAGLLFALGLGLGVCWEEETLNRKSHPLLGWSDVEDTRQPFHPPALERDWEVSRESGQIVPPPVHRAAPPVAVGLRVYNVR